MEHPVSPSPARRWLRRLFLLLLAAVSLPGLFYAIENIRGRNAWNHALGELETKGEKIAWEDFIPAPIPEEQNMLKAPGMEFFSDSSKTKPSWNKPEDLADESLKLYGDKDFHLATLTFVGETSTPAAKEKSSSPHWENDLAFAAGEKSILPLWDHFLTDFEFTLLQDSPLTLRAPILTIRATTLPSETQLRKDLGEGEYSMFQLRKGASEYTYELWARSSKENAYALLSAKDYLAFTDRFSAELDLVRVAMKRPSAFWQVHPTQPTIKMTANIGSLMQLLKIGKLRSQAFLLQGDADGALRELDLLFAARMVTRARPQLLINLMVSLGVHGQEMETFGFGLRAGTWRDSHLALLQNRFSSLNFVADGIGTLRAERAAFSQTLQYLTPEQIGLYFKMEDTFSPLTRTDWWKDSGWYFGNLAPSGWIRQNMAKGSLNAQLFLDASDKQSLMIHPDKIKDAESKAGPKSKSPYAFLVIESEWCATTLQRAAHAQTTAHLGVLACALERHRLATGKLPETLDALVPNYLAKLPRQVVHDHPFHYRLEKDGGCTLWSEGWDLADDSGKISPYEGFSGRESKDWGYRLPGRPK